MVSLFSLLLVSTGIAQSDFVAETRAFVQEMPFEAFDDARGTAHIRDTKTLDIDGDGEGEVLVLVEPRFRQTPSISIFTRGPTGEPLQIFEALAPGPVVPVDGVRRDVHAVGLGIDMSASGEDASLDAGMLAGMARQQGMSLVVYESFMHAELGSGFSYFLGKSDSSLPNGTGDTCETFQLSHVDSWAIGSVPGSNDEARLVVLTAEIVSVYQIRGVSADGVLDKTLVQLPRPRDLNELIEVDGQVLGRDAGGDVQRLLPEQ
jgi:hypothetical protein